MQPFVTLTGIAAPLPLENVDTDKILPARFMKTIQRNGLGVNLFDALRYDADGRERPDFILNQDPYRDAEILIAYENFGCGSSREHAPWALLGFGIRCIVAPSFADIFYGNCFKNGILPVRLPRPLCDELMKDARQPDKAVLTVDLEQQLVRRQNGSVIAFEIEAGRREALLNGLDDIALTMQLENAIERHEKADSASTFHADIPLTFEDQ